MKCGGFMAGLLCGALLFGSGTAMAVSAGVMATPSRQPIYVDGALIPMTVYAIDGNNYVKLRDIGQAMDFNVYWDDGVRVDSTSGYTGTAPDGTEGLRAEIRQATNDLRLANGAAALASDPLLDQAAQVRALEMAESGVYDHTRPDGRPAHTVTDSDKTGENLHRVSRRYLEAQGLSLAELVVGEWAASAVHRTNLLHSGYGSFGVGVAAGVTEAGEPCWYCVQIFLLDGYAVTWMDGVAPAG